MLNHVLNSTLKIINKHVGIPVVKNYKATTYSKAFILNALAASLIATIAIQTRNYLDNIDTTHGIYAMSNLQKSAIVALSTFISAMIIYILMYILVEFGGGMIA